MMTTETATTYWVCVDCYFAHHGIADETVTPDREPLSLIPETAEVTAGLLWSEHEDDCPNRPPSESLDECECEHVTFSWSACDGCGSTLGGAREALTVWEEVTPQ